jgi:Tol biopolymer transport system component
MLTKSGAKLMDFGLARATGMAGPSSSGVSMAALTQSPTMAQPLTAEGTIVGTFQYMAPEQLEGKEADARSDLWSLGCVLYEMATGKRAFEGATQASLIGAIMRDPPRAMSELAPMSPPALERLVQQCLAKDPDERWQSAGDVRRELEWVAAGSSRAGVPAPVAARRRSRERQAWILAGVLAAVLLSLLVAFPPWSARRVEPPLVRFPLAPPEPMALQGPAETALSPDGRSLAFVATDSGGVSRIFVRALASPEARVVAGTERGGLPFWSPDGHWLGFFGDGKLRKVPLDGGQPLVLCDAPDGRGGAWSPRGVIVFAPNNQGPIARVSVNGGAATQVTRVDEARHDIGHRYPQFLPDGRHFLYVAIGSGEEVTTYAGGVDGGKAVEVCRAGSAARWASPGYLLFLDTGPNSPRRRLLARHFDPATLRATGDAELVLDDVSSNNFGYPNVATNDFGTLVVQHWSDPHVRLVWRDRHGAEAGVAVEDLDGANGMALSPKGDRLAYLTSNPRDLSVLDLASGISTRLTFENRLVGNPGWSHDGRRIVFSRASARGWEIRTKAADGSGPDSLVFHGPSLFSFAQDWSRDGRWLVALVSDSLGSFDLWRVPMTGQGKPEIYQHTTAREQNASLSPDGKWLAYTAGEGDQREFFVQSFPDPGAKYQVTVAEPLGGSWSESGGELLIVKGRGELLSMEVSTSDGFRQGATTRLFQVPPGDYGVGVLKGEQKFLMATLKDVSATSRLEVLLGWRHLLERK